MTSRRTAQSCRHCGAPGRLYLGGRLCPRHAPGGVDGEQRRYANVIPQVEAGSIEPATTQSGPRESRAGDPERAKKRRARSEYVAAFMRAWGDVSPDQERSVAQFYEAGLTIDDLVDAARITYAKPYFRTQGDQWRYLCGVAWKMLAEIQDEAARIVGAR